MERVADEDGGRQADLVEAEVGDQHAFGGVGDRRADQQRESETAVDEDPPELAVLGGLGVDRFGQTGNLPDLYGEYRLDGEAITEAMAGLLIG